jgi:predicted MPP superfamily phosphohydrolase
LRPREPWPILPRLSLIRFVFVSLFTLVNLGLAGLVIQLLRRRRPWPRLLGAAVLVWSTLMVALLYIQGFSPPSWRPFLREWLYFPLSVEMVWNLLFVQVLFLGVILVTLIMGRARKVDRTAATSPQDLSRRKFIYLAACGAVPATAIAMGVHGSDTRDDLRVRELTVPVANLPPEFEGFTIAHVSDLHSGIFCGPEKLRLIAAATNDLKADLIVVTGDIINSNITEFNDAADAIRRLESPHGVYLCEGNHDLFPGENVFTTACAEAGFRLLHESSVILPVNGRRLILGGLPWYSRGFHGADADVDRLFPTRREGDLRVVLAHHPNLFHHAGSSDLMLSGHTHGGQIMLGDVGFGPLFFDYWSGLYRRGANTLVVSNGAGDWFPCRIGAPAEIGRLRLTRA